MTSKSFFPALIILFITLVFISTSAHAQRTITSQLSHYQVIVPATMTKDADSNENRGDDLIFYDTVNGVMMSITARDGDFKSLSAYLDCTKPNLEKDLRAAQDDSTLILMDCRRSPYYTDRSIVLHFETHSYPAGLDRCIIYFFHHDKKEIQFSFVYSKVDAKTDMVYIDDIVKTVKLL